MQRQWALDARRGSGDRRGDVGRDGILAADAERGVELAVGGEGGDGGLGRAAGVGGADGVRSGAVPWTSTASASSSPPKSAVARPPAEVAVEGAVGVDADDAEMPVGRAVVDQDLSVGLQGQPLGVVRRAQIGADAQVVEHKACCRRQSSGPGPRRG